ncbi:MAG: DUF624 domain-containing protein [Eubacteriales bacterium]|nr:DUF624 domain-containing protein [Eubacteriales bacterium]
MGNLLSGVLSNDSLFGRAMNRVRIIFWANLLFVFCTVPVITAGAGFAALHYTMLKTLRGDGDIPVFKTFFEGFKQNFRQATTAWIGFLLAGGILALEWYWCTQLGGEFLNFRYIFLIFVFILVITGLYLFPVMAAFRGTIPMLLKDSVYFALHRPAVLLVILFFSVFPMILTFTDPGTLPLYGFLWVTCGFSLICLLTDRLLLKDFAKYLPKVNEYGEFVEEEPESENSEKRTCSAGAEHHQV